jgi:hypothetical protein
VFLDSRWRYCIKELVVTKCIEILTGNMGQTIGVAGGKSVYQTDPRFEWKDTIIFRHGDHEGPDDPDELWRLAVFEARRQREDVETRR